MIVAKQMQDAMYEQSAQPRAQRDSKLLGLLASGFDRDHDIPERPPASGDRVAGLHSRRQSAS